MKLFPGKPSIFPIRSRPKGMTLIELLLAVSIAVLLTGIVFLVYRTVLNTIRSQSLWRSSFSPAVAALDVLNRDFTCSLVPLGLTNAPFVLDPGTNGQAATRLCFATAETASSNDWEHYDIVQVQYLLRSGSGTNGHSLIRQCWPFRTHSNHPDSLEEELLNDVQQFHVELFDGSQWT
ncbi:PilW family protein, partial [Verrucomicrobiota bacterium]